MFEGLGRMWSFHRFPKFPSTDTPSMPCALRNDVLSSYYKDSYELQSHC